MDLGVRQRVGLSVRERGWGWSGVCETGCLGEAGVVCDWMLERG